jgi:hypothetical protein
MTRSPAESGEKNPGAEKIAAREGRDPDAPFDVMTVFMHDVPPDVVAEALARGEPRQSDTPFGEPWPLDAWPDVPSRCSRPAMTASSRSSSCVVWLLNAWASPPM